MYPLIMSHYVYFKNNFAMPFVLFLLLLINQRNYVIICGAMSIEMQCLFPRVGQGVLK